MENATENTPRRRGRPPKAAVKKAPVVKNDVTELQLQPDQDVSRPAMRPAMRDEDPRVAAAKRAAEIRGHLGTMDDGVDRFAAPRPPDGWTYEWKRKSVFGQEDHSYMTKVKRAGWEEVPLNYDEEHRAMMPANWKGNTIERDGQVLMMRPASITEEVRQIELRRARGQVSAKEQQLTSAPDGHFERTNKDSSLAKVKKAYEPINVPE